MPFRSNMMYARYRRVEKSIFFFAIKKCRFSSLNYLTLIAFLGFFCISFRREFFFNLNFKFFFVKKCCWYHQARLISTYKILLKFYHVGYRKFGVRSLSSLRAFSTTLRTDIADHLMQVEIKVDYLSEFAWYCCFLSPSFARQRTNWDCHQRHDRKSRVVRSLLLENQKNAHHKLEQNFGRKSLQRFRSANSVWYSKN